MDTVNILFLFIYFFCLFVFVYWLKETVRFYCAQSCSCPLFEELVGVFSNNILQKRVLGAGQVFPSSYVYSCPTMILLYIPDLGLKLLEISFTE